MKKRICVDIETMSSAPDAAVIAIGACSFNDSAILNTFEILIDPADATLYGSVSPLTMEWWGKQEPTIRQRMFSGTDTAEGACNRFSTWCKAQKAEEAWANSPCFDISILRNLYKQLKLDFPIHFREERCIRTIYALAKEHEIYYGTAYATDRSAHDALSDAVTQARAVQICLNNLAKRNNEFVLGRSVVDER